MSYLLVTYTIELDSIRSKLSITTLPEVVEMKGKKAEFEALSKQC